MGLVYTKIIWHGNRQNFYTVHKTFNFTNYFHKIVYSY